MAERNLDFDKVINRKNTRCLKYDFAVKRGKPADVLPLWVADMDFETSSYIEDALVERSKEGIFGYSEVQTPYFEIIANWMKLHHNWEIQEDWLIKTPGVVFALAMAVKAYTQPGDSVLIQLPVYYPFSEVIQDNGRKVVSSNLYQGEDNRYHIDFQDFEKKIVEENVKLFFLCNPHNPVGRVWSAEELEKLGDICVKNGVTVVSDEIHQDFVFKGKHQVFAGLKKEFQDISITCTSPSKTFNLASMMISNIFIPNPELRRKFRKQLDAAGISQLGVLGLVATEAAYSKGEEWYQAMHAYVEANINYTKEYVEKYLPGVKMTDLEGTYLVWLDFRETGLTVEDLEDLILNKARLWLDSGKIFGKAAEGFTNYLFTVYADESFANVAFDQCQIALNGKPVSAITNDKRSIANFSMENSTIKITAVTQQFIINTSSNKNQDYGNVIFRNNTFYCPSGKVNQLVLFNGSASGIANLTIENNTFINLETNTGGYVNIGNLAKTSIKNNIFWTNTDGTGNVVIIRPQITSPTGDICADNLLYKTMTYNWQMFYGGKLPFEGAEELKALTSNPFDGGTFDLANGIFVPNAEYAEYGATN